MKIIVIAMYAIRFVTVVFHFTSPEHKYEKKPHQRPSDKYPLSSYQFKMMEMRNDQKT